MLKIANFGFGTVVKFVENFFQSVWIVIRSLCLQPLLTIGLVWLILIAFLPGEKITSTFITVFLILAGMGLIYAILGTAYKIIAYIKSTPSRKRKKKKTVVSVSEVTEEDRRGKPMYFRVKQNPKYVMAEYPDRYELYYDDDGDLKLVQVKQKEQEEQNGND